MNILELVKAKTGAKDLIEHKGQYFEAKSIKEYLKLCKKVKNLQVTFNAKDLQIIFEHTHGLAKFNRVGINHFNSMDEVEWFSHELKWQYNTALGQSIYVPAQKLKTGKAWSVEL